MQNTNVGRKRYKERNSVVTDTKTILYLKKKNTTPPEITHGPQDFTDLSLNCTNSNTVSSNLEIFE